jgi:sortase A
MRATRRSLSFKMLERALYGLGFLLLIFWVAVHMDARRYQNRQMKILAESKGALGQSSALDTAVPGSVIGQIAIPRLGLSAVVTEGTDAKTLLRAVGHLAGTAFPGRPGNIVLAGHRDTYFRSLAGIAQDDTIRITTPRGRYAYQVISTQVVPPNRTEVLLPSTSPLLTLVTCYPFRYIGRAPMRFIVQARQVPSGL